MPIIYKVAKPIFCFGSEYDYNFIGDQERNSDDHPLVDFYEGDNEETGFPLTNVQNADLNIPYVSDNYGIYINTVVHRVNYRIKILYDFINPVFSEIFSILNHNFKQMYNTAVYHGYENLFRINLAWGNDKDNFGSSNAELAIDHDQPIIIHNIHNYFRYVQLELEISLDDTKTTPDSSEYGKQWAIGRLILCSSGQVMTPTYGYKAQYQDKLMDPSIVNRKYGGGHSNIRMDVYRERQIEFQSLPVTDSAGLELLYQRQGQNRPILMIGNPVDMFVGAQDHTNSNNLNPLEAIYGYFSEHIIINRLVNRFFNVSLTITEARKQTWT